MGLTVMHTAKGGWAGPGELVFHWGGCIPLVPRLAHTDSYPRGLFTQHVTPVNHHPHSREVQCSASECVNPRGRGKAGVSHSHLSLNAHLGERQDLSPRELEICGPLEGRSGLAPVRWSGAVESRAVAPMSPFPALHWPSSDCRQQTGNQGSWCDYGRRGPRW